MSTSLRVQRSTVGRQVADRLRDAVADGRLLPGERLTERALCEMTGAGRASVREALRALEAEGVIDNAPHRGPSVARVSAAQARDLYAVRALLEGFAARGFARHAGEADRAALEASLDALGRAEGTPALLAAKAEFYDTLVRGCGNVLVGEMLGRLHRRVMVLRATSMSRPERLPASLRELRALADALARRDARAAERLAIAHIRAAEAAALPMLQEDTP